jgi:hypothetical protein
MATTANEDKPEVSDSAMLGRVVYATRSMDGTAIGFQWLGMDQEMNDGTFLGLLRITARSRGRETAEESG